ncbi:MAG: PorP/SprF family type IX secretion system membrane protein [Candidatus Cyclobacteriaceae bacterium M3_2C_046]
MKKYIILLFFNFLQLAPLIAQDKPIFSNFFMNPFAYNPAYAGDEYRPSLTLAYRQQWMGIEGAPVTTSASFHLPVGTNMSFGTNIFNDRRSVLNTSSALLSLAYKVPFDIDHYVKFGLSGGAGFNSISDFNEIMNNPKYQNDVALINALQSSIYLDGQFGFNYHFRGFNAGFALPRLFNTSLISQVEFNQGEIDPLNSYQIMINFKSYNKELPISFEPHLIYRLQSETMAGYFEGAGIIHFQNAAWLGGSYRQDYGITLMGGININDKMQVGYAYDLVNTPVAGFTNGTHEIALKLNFGEEKRPKKRTRSVKQEQEKDPYLEYLENKQQEEKQPAITPAQEDLGEQGQVQNYNGPQTVTKGTHLLELEKGFYVIVGTFPNFEKAENYSDWLFEKGYYTKYGYATQAKYYYVYAFYSLADKEKATTTLAKLKEKGMFKDAWLLTVE